jgi:hypothetical protein
MTKYLNHFQAHSSVKMMFLWIKFYSETDHMELNLYLVSVVILLLRIKKLRMMLGKYFEKYQMIMPRFDSISFWLQSPCSLYYLIIHGKMKDKMVCIGYCGYLKGIKIKILVLGYWDERLFLFYCNKSI